MNWQMTEDRVRKLASFLWSSNAEPEHIAGVNIDCVIKIRSDYWILIEITQNETLGKLRDDLAKFSSVKPYLFSQGIYAECYFICEEEPAPSLKETGDSSKVEVLSINSFSKKFLNYDSYYYTRSQKKFGSAVDRKSGNNDERKYISIKYKLYKNGREFSIDEIVAMLKQNKRIILMGNYGTGKSRCIKEIFVKLNEKDITEIRYPLAINLRDNWGVKRGQEIIRRHFDDLGLSMYSENVIKIFEGESIIFLLDGFDEIGAQSWSDNVNKLKEIRAESLKGVKDLIRNTKGGLIITGREHYFNTSEEMFTCLGLNPKDTIIIECPDEFTELEMKEYLDSIVDNINVPTWMPKRALICQIISEFDSDYLKRLLNEPLGMIEFWRTLIDAICERESNINVSLDAITIKKVLIEIARMTRNKIQDVGPITINEMNKAFENVVGTPPVDESATMLQRLPALGRVGSESHDRQFIDKYILDGLRAEDIVENVTQQSEKLSDLSWSNPLSDFGLSFVANDILGDSGINRYKTFIRKAANWKNGILVGDVMASILLSEQNSMDFKYLSVDDSHISVVDLSDKLISNLSINSSIIDKLDITNCNVENVTIKNCIIKNLIGVSSEKGLPEWITGCEIESYETIHNVTRIKNANLSVEQRVFITIIKKIYFQPGAGRMEEALLRGLGSSADKKAANKIINMLLKENIIEMFKGNEGNVYTPVRKHTRRMDAIINSLTLSEDYLWKQLN
ncbi:NACHT domain-containing protein [Paenibacillus rhizophilus]|uniref:Novel STAND NTPase 3 domain-containing protein n=1 Tax=Paenibacillus rhizophilus TaxID=1850366 RepID=A0A3N9PRN7_9BACL|nr:hypothetical protein [Paenibacillus rhizophilus]RQW07906.1 hypothetical protein EH198_23875 [Paenibacillus rhizophilus]